MTRDIEHSKAVWPEETHTLFTAEALTEIRAHASENGREMHTSGDGVSERGNRTVPSRGKCVIL